MIKSRFTKLVASTIFASAILTTSDTLAVLTVDYTASASAVTNGTGLSSGAVPYSLVTPRSPSVGQNSYGGTNPTFYGGVSTTGTGTINQFLFESSDSSMRFRLNVVTSGDSAAGLFLWKQSDFLNAQSVGSVGLDGTSSFSLNSRRFGSNLTTGVRFVFQEGSNFYISDLVGPVPAAYGPLALLAPSSANWFNYNPASSIGTIGSAATPTFSGIDVLGVYFSISSTATGNATIAFTDFQVNATAVPEPSTTALVIAVFAILVIGLRRRMA